MYTVHGIAVRDRYVTRHKGNASGVHSFYVLKSTQLDDVPCEKVTVPAVDKGTPNTLYLLALDELASEVGEGIVEYKLRREEEKSEKTIEDAIKDAIAIVNAEK